MTERALPLILFAAAGLLLAAPAWGDGHQCTLADQSKKRVAPDAKDCGRAGFRLAGGDKANQEDPAMRCTWKALAAGEPFKVLIPVTIRPDGNRYLWFTDKDGKVQQMLYQPNVCGEFGAEMQGCGPKVETGICLDPQPQKTSRHPIKCGGREGYEVLCRGTE